MPLHSLMFGWEYPPLHTGGLGVACQGLVRGLTRNGVRVTLVLPMDLQQHPDAELLRGPADITEMTPSVRFVPSALQPYDDHRTYTERAASWNMVDTGTAQSLTDLYGPNLGEAVERYTEASVAVTRDLAPDVVHCHDWMTYDAGIRAAKHHRVPLVAHIHATEYDRTHFQPNDWIAEKEGRGFRAADRIIAVSNYTKDLLIRHYGIDPSKITVVYNGHDVRPQSITAQSRMAVSNAMKKRGPLVLFLGRLTAQKNPTQFLEVARLVHAERPDVHFVMAGDGGLLPDLVDRACVLGLSRNILFTGKVNTREAEKLYRQADCFVMPSLSEPFGLVALEAIGHGVPVILSKQSGAAEVVEHAFKVDFWDTAKMADCIVTILRETPLAATLRSEAPRILQRLNWRNQAGEVISLYQHMLTAAR